jgi:hypothetical protein
VGCRRKTRPGRLSALDALIDELEGPRVGSGATVLDLGLGARPWTTLEWAERLVPRGVTVWGVDHAEELVDRARRDHAAEGVRYAVSSFDLPVQGLAVVRAMNVLRDGGPQAVPAAHARMVASLVEGGVLVEGSCGPQGEVGCVHWVRKVNGRGHREAVVMWLDGARGTAPLLFRDRLPRDLREGLRHGHPVKQMLADWMAAYRGLPAGPGRLAQAAAGIDGLRMLGPTAAVWAPAGGVPS